LTTFLTKSAAKGDKLSSGFSRLGRSVSFFGVGAPWESVLPYRLAALVLEKLGESLKFIKAKGFLKAAVALAILRFAALPAEGSEAGKCDEKGE
jgi:hypothetical protein